jgi:hypothetical protein
VARTSLSAHDSCHIAALFSPQSSSARRPVTTSRVRSPSARSAMSCACCSSSSGRRSRERCASRTRKGGAKGAGSREAGSSLFILTSRTRFSWKQLHPPFLFCSFSSCYRRDSIASAESIDQTMLLYDFDLPFSLQRASVALASTYNVHQRCSTDRSAATQRPLDEAAERVRATCAAQHSFGSSIATVTRRCGSRNVMSCSTGMLQKLGI